MRDEARFLVRGECEGCGWICACREGSIWPKCPHCNEQVLPGSKRLGYVAYLMEESEAWVAAHEARVQARIEAWLS